MHPSWSNVLLWCAVGARSYPLRQGVLVRDARGRNRYLLYTRDQELSRLHSVGVQQVEAFLYLAIHDWVSCL